MYRTATGRELKLSGAANNWPGAADANGLRTGSQGNDVYFGGGKETLRGLGGDDVYNLFSASAVVDEAAEGGTDTVVSNLWGSTTLAANVENLFLQGAGSSVGIGNDLDNIIKAGATAATLYGAAGDDVLVGGAGGDVFRIVAGSGSEAVVSFQHGWDAISLEGYGIGSFAALQALTQQVGSDVQISFANGEILVMRDIDGATLSAADFNFLQGVERDAGSSYMGNPTNAYHGNGWYVLNNTWGSSQLKHGTDYLLESAFSKADLTGATAFSWSYPLTTNPYASVLAYPEVAFGHNPHGGGFNPNVTPGVFPACVADMLAFDVDYDVAIAGNLSGFNVAYDIWFTGKPYGTAADVTTELMIWVHKGSANAFGSLVGRYTDGTFSANIYRSGTYVALVADADCLSGTLRVGAIVAYLVELGIMSTSEYLASIELGSEVFSGSGSLLINNFDFTLTQTTATGQISTAAVTGAGTTITETPPPSAGNDIYDLADRFDTIRDAGGTDTIISTIGRDLNDYPDIENLTLAGTADINATGNKWANVLIGNDGDNILDGGPGADILKGGLGNDTYVLAGATNDTIIDTGGVDTITSTISRDLRNYSGIENLTLTFSAHVDAIGNQADNVLQGNSGKNLLQGLGGNDTLHGGAGNDTLEGGDGQDTLYGGVGNDTYVLADGSDTVIDEAGWDTITSTISRNLNDYPDIENLTLLGTANIDATGNSWSNTLVGNDGDNILDGGPGADILQGGLGNDTYVLAAATNDTIYDVGGIDTITSTVTRDLRNYSGIENLTLTFGAHVDGTGNQFANLIRGNAGNNTLWGLDGDDTLEGGAGNDTLQGGAGNDILDGGLGQDTLHGGAANDTYVLADGTDTVIDTGGWDTITSTISRSLANYPEIENLTLLGTANIDATGNNWANILSGNDGDNILDGGAGADTLIGGLGNDTYVLLAATNDTIIDTSGNDTITSTISRNLADFTGIENITLTFSANANATGDAAANILTGNGGNNTLDGLGGNDTLLGGAGDDRLVGGLGRDVMTGGTGRDSFVFTTAQDSDTTATTRDTITDFLSGTDLIDLSAIDADLTQSGRQSFTLLDPNAGFSGTAGELRWFGDDAGAILEFDADGDGIADWSLALSGVSTLSHSDFLL